MAETNRNQGAGTDPEQNPAGKKDQGGRAQSGGGQSSEATEAADDRSTNRGDRPRERQPEEGNKNSGQGGGQGQGGQGQNRGK